ncbi:tRNA pseudouridine(55) synthase TruB [Gammaproteobacteria bacterium]|nr:tRNA pseudouridine(55) synthase TruB [Gammaproteobacteria bacterium]
MAKRRRGRNISGILVLDKPQGESSNRSLQRVKRLFDAAKAGHTGSLDPLATGVLPLCFGEATKISQFLLDSDKAYRTIIKLGVKTASGDSEGEVISATDASGVTSEQLAAALETFSGDIEQVPSMYSALKHQGVPLYKLAREGKTVERKVRTVKIYDLQLLSFFLDEVELEIHCSKGTYIRTIADDLGDLLGVGAHVISLRRLKAGPFSLENSIKYEELDQLLEQGGFAAIDEHLIAADQAIPELPQVILPSITADYIRQGQAVIARHLPTDGLVRLYDEKLFLGIGEILDDGRVAPRRLLSAN